MHELFYTKSRNVLKLSYQVLPKHGRNTPLKDEAEGYKSIVLDLAVRKCPNWPHK